MRNWSRAITPVSRRPDTDVIGYGSGSPIPSEALHLKAHESDSRNPGDPDRRRRLRATRGSGAHELLKESGLIIETHASGTNVEGDLAQILQVVERIHAVLHAEGAVRLITVVKLETRTDKVPTLAGKRL